MMRWHGHTHTHTRRRTQDTHTGQTHSGVRASAIRSATRRGASIHPSPHVNHTEYSGLDAKYHKCARIKPNIPIADADVLCDMRIFIPVLRVFVLHP